MTNTIELHQVTKRFGNHVAVDHLDLVVPAGTVYGFIGPNGSGKTTTLRMILGIFYPDEGKIEVFGARRRRVADDRVSYLPEERGLYKTMKVRAILRFYARLKGRQHCDADIDQWLDRLDLTDWAERRVATLSKGMAQKVQFIAAVISRPQLVVLDEPFSGLDPVNMEILKDAVLELRKRGTTVVFSTHDMDVAERMCDTILMIFRGRKVLDGDLESIQQQYGADTIRIRMPQVDGPLENIPGIAHINEYGPYKELRMQRDADPQQILRQLTSLGTIEHFQIARPSLHDIFVRIAGVEAHDSGDLQHA